MNTPLSSKTNTVANQPYKYEGLASAFVDEAHVLGHIPSQYEIWIEDGDEWRKIIGGPYIDFDETTVYETGLAELGAVNVRIEAASNLGQIIEEAGDGRKGVVGLDQAYTWTGKQTFEEGVEGLGSLPLGTIIPIDTRWSNVNAPASGVIDSNGFALCNGQAVSGLSGQALGTGATNLPNLTDSRFLRGSTVAGATGGVDSITPSGSVSGSVSSSFSGTAKAYRDWFQNNNYTPGGSVSTTVTFNTNSLDSSSYQDAHSHGAGSYMTELTAFNSTSLGGRQASGSSWSSDRQIVINAIGGGIGSTTGGFNVQGSSSSTRAGFRSATYGTSESSSFSGSALNKRTNWGSSGNYVPAGSVSSSFSGSFSGSLVSVIPKYFNAVYLIRVK